MVAEEAQTMQSSNSSEKPDLSDRECEHMTSSEKDVERTGAVQVQPEPGPDRETDAAQATTTPELRPSHGPIPDGGVEAWLQVLGSWVTLVVTWGLVNTYGVFQTYYETELLTSSSSSDISWIGSLQASLLMLVGVFAGPLYDAGYFRHLLISGLFLVVFGQFMTSLGTEYWHILLAQGICTGVGMGFTFLPSTAILAQYFSTRRAWAIGIASTGSPLAGIVFPIIFSKLVETVGFGWATRVIAFILLGLSVIPVIFMKTRVPPSGKKRSVVDLSAFRDSGFMLFVLASFFMFLCLYTTFFYIQLFAELRGLSTESFSSSYTVTLLNVGSVFGRLLPNWLADRVGSVNICFVCGAVSAVLMYGWLGIDDLGGLIVFALLYGLFSGGIVSVTPSALMGMTPDLARLGGRMGTVFMFAGLSVLAGTPIAGAILGGFSAEEWQAVIGYSAGGLTVGTGFYLASRLVLYKRNGRKIA